MKILSSILLLAGLAPASAIAGTDISRAAQLPPIDAGSILNQIQNSQNHFPTPPLTTLDMCVFSEFKNNKCFFKCQSGAILTEPAVKPDFSTGEPAGACATHILRPVTQTVFTNKAMTSSQLKDLLTDSDPEIRKAAVKSAKKQILNSYINEQVLEIFKNANERVDVRVEAARTLSYASSYYKVPDAFVELLKYGTQPRELRIMTYKALFGAAAVNSRYSDFLADAVKYNEKDRDARRAAIWALFSSAQNSRPQELLTDLVKYGNEEENTRIEAIVSLYGAVGNYRVRELLLDLAKDANERKPVRLAAIKALSGAADSSIQRFLDDTIRSERDQELRAAAIEAASPDLADLKIYFHLGYKLENGVYISPIERE